MEVFTLEGLISWLLRLIPGETVAGEPYVVGAKSFTPIARVRVFEALGGRLRIRAIEPTEIVEDSGAMSQTFKVSRLPVEQVAQLAAVLVPVLVFFVASFWRRSQERTSA